MAEYGWDLDSGNGGGGGGSKAEFAKFPEGVTRIRIVDDAPFQRWTHYMKKFNRSINCPGKGCPICEVRRQEKANKMPYTHQMAKRFAINVINRETNRVEIMEQGKTFFEDVRDLMDDLKAKGKTLIEADLRVKRRGKTKDDTSYRLDIDEVYPLNDADQKMLENRIDLKEYFKPHTNEQILALLNGGEWDKVMTSNQNEEQKSEESIAQEEEIEVE